MLPDMFYQHREKYLQKLTDQLNVLNLLHDLHTFILNYILHPGGLQMCDFIDKSIKRIRSILRIIIITVQDLI